MFRSALVNFNTSKYAILNTSYGDFNTNYYEAYPVTYPYAPNDTGIPIPQIITMEQTSDITVFRSHYSYLGAALAVMFIGVLVVVPCFHGFWELGRNASLNPLEVAKAFNAEMLRGEGSNSSVSQLTKNFGNKQVQYGEVIDEGDWRTPNGASSNEKRLELADPSRVMKPMRQAMYI
jgi:hypothetical protein